MSIVLILLIVVHFQIFGNSLLLPSRNSISLHNTKIETSELERLAQGHCNYIWHESTQQTINHNNIWSQKTGAIDSICFDQTIQVSMSCQAGDAAMKLLDSLDSDLKGSFKEYDNVKRILQGYLTEAIATMKSLNDSCAEKHPLQCRLALIRSTKCPKWHEDNVQFRLLQTIFGEGTQWVNPNRIDIRCVNYILRDLLDRPAVVSSSLVRALEAGDVLIMRGKKANVDSSNFLFSAPVLHRSPVNSEQAPRLLLSVSIP
jgi:hypothetical protein